MIRYRFKTKSTKDYRPLIFNPAYPWWCTGHAANGSYVTIVFYLPESENLLKYWDDAYDIDYEENVEIQFTDRFPKAEWYTGDELNEKV